MPKWKSEVILTLVALVIASLAFSGGAIYQYYLKDKLVIETQRSALVYWQNKYEALSTKHRELLSYYAYTATPIDILEEQAIAWLDRAARSHQPYLENDDPDDDEFHQGAIDRYASIKRLILKLR